MNQNFAFKVTDLGLYSTCEKRRVRVFILLQGCFLIGLGYCSWHRPKPIVNKEFIWMNGIMF